jgi:group I intron endonuclease
LTIGIYKITNLINNKIYIGQSIHIERRWQEHKKPSSCSCIGQAIKKYGINNFSFEIIEECPTNRLAEREKYWINYFNTLVPNGYNVLDETESNASIYHCFDKQILLNIIFDL